MSGKFHVVHIWRPPFRSLLLCVCVVWSISGRKKGKLIVFLKTFFQLCARHLDIDWKVVWRNDEILWHVTGEQLEIWWSYAQIISQTCRPLLFWPKNMNHRLASEDSLGPLRPDLPKWGVFMDDVVRWGQLTGLLFWLFITKRHQFCPKVWS